METAFTSYGIAAALLEINRRNQPESFADAEQRLAEKMKPARLAPLVESPEKGSAGH
jgi:hypothetical protein